MPTLSIQRREAAPFPALSLKLVVGLVGLLASSSAVAGSPQAPVPVTIAPAILDIAETGSGCPIGNGGMVHQIRNNTPVFVYMGWGLQLNGSAIAVPTGQSNGTNITNPQAQDNHVIRGTVAKFCKASVSLGSAPVGYQVHVAEVTVSGFAKLDPESFVGIHVNTRFDHAEAGRSRTTVKASELKNGSFSLTLTPSPVTWSPCINETGRLPVISIRTSVSVNGTALASGTYSSGQLGPDDEDMSKALSVHFVPEWRPCPAESLAPLPAPSETQTATTTLPLSVPTPTASAEPAPTATKPPVQDPPMKDPPLKDPPLEGPPEKDPPMNMGGM